MNLVMRAIEAVIFNSRWLLAPFLLGMIVGLAALLYTFAVKLAELLFNLPFAAQDEVIIGVLKLVDLSLIANLIMIVICSSYENFLGNIDPREHPNWPAGLVGIGFSDLKQKLLGSIVAIVAVNVLDWFMDIDRSADNLKLTWVVGTLIAFAIAMLLLALADRLSGADEKKGGQVDS
jgi:uncharacterized protein (TIGR00645 family)